MLSNKKLLTLMVGMRVKCGPILLVSDIFPPFIFVDLVIQCGKEASFCYVLACENRLYVQCMLDVANSP